MGTLAILFGLTNIGLKMYRYIEFMKTKTVILKMEARQKRVDITVKTTTQVVRAFPVLKELQLEGPYIATP